MATANEILATMAEGTSANEQAAEVCTIDRCTRAVTIPETLRIVGVETDQNVTRRVFKVMCAYRGTDLSTFGVRINFMNANKEKDVYIVTDARRDGDYLTFSWVISRKALNYKGRLQFIVCMVCDGGADEEREWNSTLGEFAVLEGLEVEPTGGEVYQTRDVLDQLLRLVVDQKDEAVQTITAEGTNQITAVQAAGAKQEAIIAAKGAATLETIPDDYATLHNKVQKNAADILLDAPAIIPTATGEIVTISDSANRPLAGLRLYGKTTQDGTPTPDAPVPLVNVGADGNIGVYAQGKNLIDMRGAAGGTDSGITVTVNADGSYVMNGTATDINVNLWFAGYFNANAPTLFVLPAGTYYVAGVALYSGAAFVSNNYQINGSFFTIAEDTPITGVRCTFVTSGQTYNNTVIYPIVAAGNAVAAYEPYKDGGSLTASTPNGLPGIPVSSGGNYTDASGQQWVCDEIDSGRGEYVENIKTVVLTGAEQVVTFDGWHPGSYRIEAGYGNAYTVPPEQTNERVLCTHATAKNVHNVAVNGYIGVSVTNEGLTLCLSYDHARADDLKAYLSAQYAAGKPVQVAYALAEPIVTPIPASELAAYRAMTSQYPNTTVYNNAGAGMQVDYIADTKNYIDQRIAALLNA